MYLEQSEINFQFTFNEADDSYLTSQQKKNEGSNYERAWGRSTEQ